MRSARRVGRQHDVEGALGDEQRLRARRVAAR
jgi:hypothetical protein